MYIQFSWLEVILVKQAAVDPSQLLPSPAMPDSAYTASDLARSYIKPPSWSDADRTKSTSLKI